MPSAKIGELWGWRWENSFPNCGGTTEILMVVERINNPRSCQFICINIETDHEDCWSFRNSSAGKWIKISPI
jgi:hypothetical protein